MTFDNLPFDIKGLIFRTRFDLMKADKVKEEDRRAWIDDNCHDISASSCVRHPSCRIGDEWGDKSICIAFGDSESHACYIEIQQEPFAMRFKYIINFCTTRREIVEYKQNLWIFHYDDCECITEHEPPVELFEYGEDYYELCEEHIFEEQYLSHL